MFFIKKKTLFCVFLVFMIYLRHRLPANQWWMNLRSLMRILAHHESSYKSETVVKSHNKEVNLEENEDLICNLETV